MIAQVAGAVVLFALLAEILAKLLRYVDSC